MGTDILICASCIGTSPSGRLLHLSAAQSESDNVFSLGHKQIRIDAVARVTRQYAVNLDCFGQLSCEYV